MESITVYYLSRRDGPYLSVRVQLAIAQRLGLKPRQTIDHDMLTKVQAEQAKEKNK
jgi:hypothetical protein